MALVGLKRAAAGDGLGLRAVPGYGTLQTASGTWWLFLRTMRSAVSPPFSWINDSVGIMALTLRMCLVPILLAAAAFSIGLFVTMVGGALQSLGTVDRFGGGFAVATVRETAFWVTSMIFAGVIGSAVTADLGARKIREELDALAVLGVDQVRMLVVPRVLGLTLMGPVLGLMALLSSLLLAGFVSPLLLRNFTTSDMFAGVAVFVTVADIVSLCLKLLICGLLVSTVCCYKGLTCSGGTSGVGRAVNQAVLINFVALWAFNALWNSTFLALFPEMQILRG